MFTVVFEISSVALSGRIIKCGGGSMRESLGGCLSTQTQI